MNIFIVILTGSAVGEKNLMSEENKKVNLSFWFAFSVHKIIALRNVIKPPFTLKKSEI